MSEYSGISVSSTEEFVGSVYDLSSRNRYYPTREGDVRKKIFRMSRAKQNISFVYRESLRSMMASFNDIVYLNEEGAAVDVKVIHANQERAVAKITQEDNIILPIMSIAQTTSVDDPKRMRSENLLVHEVVRDTQKNRYVRVLSMAPRAVNIQYEINIWSKYRSDLDQILEQIRLKFNPEMEVPTSYSTLAKAQLGQETVPNAIVAPDKEDRLVQRTLEILLRTYIPSPKYIVTNTGKIEEFNAEFYLPRTPDNNGPLSNE